MNVQQWSAEGGSDTTTVNSGATSEHGRLGMRFLASQRTPPKVVLSPTPTSTIPPFTFMIQKFWDGTLVEVRDSDRVQWSVTMHKDGTLTGASLVRDRDGNIVTGPLQTGVWYQVEIWLLEKPAFVRYGKAPVDANYGRLTIDTPHLDDFERSSGMVGPTPAHRRRKGRK